MQDVAKTPEEKEEQRKIPSDDPITKEEEDFLNRRPFVKNVVSLIKANIKPPYSIGIYGDWGSGKTSIMRLIEKQIRSLNEYRVIWFDAWEYENETNLIYPLVHLIQKEVSEKKLEEIKQTVAALRSTILRTVGDAILGRVTEGGVNIEKIQKNWDDYMKKHTGIFETWIDRVGEIKEDFRKLTDAACEPKGEGEEKKKFIVIFIDDLDRCLPENSIKILHSIKNIFSKGNCVFVLGIDKGTIARIIKGKYPTLEDFECTDYLAKIVPFGLDVPECQDIDFDNYLKFLLFNKLRIKLGGNNKVKHESDIVRIDTGEISRVCRASRLHNPRKIKKSVVAFYLYYKIRQSNDFVSDFINEVRSEMVTYQDVLFFSLFCQFWNDLFEKVLISNSLFSQLAKAAVSGDFENWQSQFSPPETHRVLKSYVRDENLHHFLRGWGQTKSEGTERDKFKQRDQFINVLIRIGKLIGLKRE